MWHADWFVHCDKCGDLQWMDGKNLQAAKVTARKAGWSISATRALCPDCRPTKYAPRPETGAAKFDNESQSPVSGG